MAHHHVLTGAAPAPGREGGGGRDRGRRPSRLVPLACLVPVLALAGAGCDGILDVDTNDAITPGDLDRAGPAAVPTLVHGMAGAVHEALDGLVRYSALLTDEMILAGTFPDRAQVDRRRILPDNGAVTEDFYGPLHQARFQADTTVLILQERLDLPAFEPMRESMLEGIARGRLYGGYTRVWMAESMCWSILTGVYPETAPLLPDDRMLQALAFLEEAEVLAEAHGFDEVRLAAITGQARARLWMGEIDEAGALAERVPPGFLLRAEFSRSHPDQYNQTYALTWGDTEAIRWTIGDGTTGSRGNEAFEHLGTFLALNLVRNRPPGFATFQGSIPVLLQLRYGRPESSIPLASGVEATLIRAEVHVRRGETQVAQELLNGVRADFPLRAALVWGVSPPPAPGALAPLTLTGQLGPDLRRVAAERARELWLTGDRQVTARRLRLDPTVGIDLFPPVKVGIGGGDDLAFPIVGRELAGNPHLGPGDACPPGQEPGGWR